MEYLKIFSSVFHKLTNPYPLRDWYILLTGSAAIALVLIGIAIYFFVGIQSGFIIGERTDVDTKSPTVSREKLSQILETYEKRRVNFEAGNFSMPKVSDPSR